MYWVIIVFIGEIVYKDFFYWGGRGDYFIFNFKNLDRFFVLKVCFSGFFIFFKSYLSNMVWVLLNGYYFKICFFCKIILKSFGSVED